MTIPLHKRGAVLGFCLWVIVGVLGAQSRVAGSHPAQDGYNGYPPSQTTNTGRWFDYDRPSYFGVRVGVNAPALFYRGVGGVPNNTLCGLNVGVVYGIQLSERAPLFFEAGLAYSEKGARMNATPTTQKITYKMGYLDLPFVFKYKVDLGVDDLSVQPFFGGFLACGISGKSKYFTERVKEKTFRHKTFKRFDSGFRMGCGAVYQNFYFEMSYEVGLVNVAGKHYAEYGFDHFDDKIRTGCFSATAGLNF